MAMRVTVRGEEIESGLARICQSPRGFVISLNGEPIARVGWGHADDPTKPWHWYGGDEKRGVARLNTAAEHTFFETKEAARDDAVAYIKAHVRAAKTLANVSPSPPKTGV